MSKSRALSIASFAVAVAIVALLSAPPPRASRGNTGGALANARVLGALGNSHRALLSDVYWLRAINLAGDVRSADEGAALYYLGDLITELDGDFLQPYLLVALNVPYRRFQGETWKNGELAESLLKKGVDSFPNEIRLWLYLAYTQLYTMGAPASAAKTLMTASRTPGALPWMSQLATRILAQEGQFEVANAFIGELSATADEDSKKVFDLRLKELALEKILKGVDAAVAAFTARTGRAPLSLSELIATGDLPGLPEDPMGGNIVLGEDGRATSTAITNRLEVFTDHNDPTL